MSAPWPVMTSLLSLDRSSSLAGTLAGARTFKLSNLAVNNRRFLLAEDHKREAVKVGECPAAGLVSQALREVRLIPLSHYIGGFELLRQGAGAQGARDGEFQRSQSKASEIDRLTRNASLIQRTIDKGGVLVHDVNDDGKLPSIGPVVYEHNATDLDKIFVVHPSTPNAQSALAIMEAGSKTEFVISELGETC